MLSYQHAYHAGNFADAHKHALLASTLTHLKSKGQKLCVLDTHAGRGMYHFSSEEAQKKGEFKNGVTALWEYRSTPSPISDYYRAMEKHNASDTLETYTGSPQIAKDILGDGHRFIFAELHPGEFSELQKNFHDQPNVQTLQKSGFTVMLENVPPPERRGLVVMDPPYEMETDYKDVPKNLNLAYKKWPQGIFLLWYPLLTSQAHKEMLVRLRKTDVKDVLISEIALDHVPKEGFAMYGSGVALINPPLPETGINEITQFIAGHLPNKAQGKVFWLDNCRIDPDNGLLEPL